MYSETKFQLDPTKSEKGNSHRNPL